MPFIISTKPQSIYGFAILAVIKLYKELFQVSLLEARMQIELLVTRDNYRIPVDEAAISIADDFIHQASKLGLACKLQAESTK